MNASGLNWEDYKFRPLPGVKPAESGGGNWMYLSQRKAPSGSNGHDTILPVVAIGDHAGKFVFYTDDNRNIVGIKSNQPRSNFESDFNYHFGISYQDWSSKFGNVFRPLKI